MLAGMLVPIKITLCCNLFTIFVRAAVHDLIAKHMKNCAIRVLVTSEILVVQPVGVI